MARQQRDLVFVSYSHKDKKWLSDLLTFLKPYQRKGLEIWADPYIQTGDRWQREIGGALQRACVGVLLVSQDFLASDFIYENELPPLLSAADSGDLTLVCVPLSSFTLEVSELDDYQWPRDPLNPLAAVTGNRRKRALVEIADAIVTAAGDCDQRMHTAASRAPARPAGRTAVSTHGTLARLNGVPGQRPNHVPRSDDLANIKRLILGDAHSAVGITATRDSAQHRLGVQGRGGIGKTVLAIDVANDADIRRTFSDGVYWVTLGQTPAIEQLQADLLRAITGRHQAIDSPAQGRELISQALTERAAVVVLDDVWQAAHADAFDAVDILGRLVITTRDSAVVSGLGAAEVQLDVLQPAAALQLLAHWADLTPAELPTEAAAIAEECGRLPLALSLAGAQIRDGASWPDLLAALQSGRSDYLDHPLGGVFSSMQLSVDALPAQQRERLLELAVFPEDVAIPESTIARYWAHTGWLTAQQTHELLRALHGKGLLYFDADGRPGTVEFHDLQRDFILLAIDRPIELHHRLLNAHEHAYAEAPGDWKWWQLPQDEPYLWDRLLSHLREAELEPQARRLLFDYRWLDAKLRARDVNRLLLDFDGLSERDAARLVESALRLSAHVLEQHQAQLAPQLTGRLLAVDSSEVAQLLDSIAQAPPACWLVPQRADLTPPGGSLLRTLVGHTGQVNAVAVSPDGRRAISVAGDGTLKVWNLDSGTIVHDIDAHTDWITALALSGDGRLAITGSVDFTVKIWDLHSGREVCDLARSGALAGYDEQFDGFFLPHYNWVNAVAISDDGRLGISGAEDGSLRVWDLDQGGLLYDLRRHQDAVNALAITADGRRLVSAQAHRLLSVWDLQTGQFVHALRGHKAAINDVALTSDGKHAVSASDDATLRVWDLERGRLLHNLIGHARRVNAVAITSDDRTAVSASRDHTLKVWDLATGTLRHDLTGHSGWVRAVALTADGTRAVSASGDRTLKVWDLERGQLLLDLGGHENWVKAVALTPNGRRAVSASADHTLKVWDLDTSRRVHRLAGHDDWVNAITLTPDGRRVITASSDHTLKVWDVHHGVLAHRLSGHTDWINAVAVTADGRRAVSAAGDHTVKVWDLQNGSLLHDLRGHDQWVYSVAVTHDGKRAVSTSFDCTVRVWDIEHGTPIAELAGHRHSVYAVALTDDGSMAVSASGDHTLGVWDLDRGRLVHELSGHSEPVVAVALHGDQRRVVSASKDHTLGIWDLHTGERVRQLTGHAGAVNAMALSPDGRQLVSASSDHTLKIWDLGSGACIRDLAGHTDAVQAVTLTPDGTHAVSAADDRTLKVWDLDTGKCVVEFHADAKTTCVVVTGKGQSIVAGDALGRLHFLKMEGCSG